MDELKDPVQYLERRISSLDKGGVRGGPDSFDPVRLKEYLLSTAATLRAQSDSLGNQIMTLSKACNQQENQHKSKVAEVETNFKKSLSKYHELDDRMNFVVNKVVHLGEQLEMANAPRQRCSDARQIMTYFEEFQKCSELPAIFSDEAQMPEAARIISQLVAVSSDLSDENFKEVQVKIEDTYRTVEAKLLSSFKEAFKMDKVEQMRQCATTLIPFKGFQACYQIFIEMIKQGHLCSTDMFTELPTLCSEVRELVLEVFDNNSELVMVALVQDIFEGPIKAYIAKKLEECGKNQEAHLNALYQLFKRSKETVQKLSEMKLATDCSFLERCRKSLFSEYLKNYMITDVEFLEEKAKLTLKHHYERKMHVKKDQPSTQGLAWLSSRSHTDSSEVLLSDSVTISLLQDNKQALERCVAFSSVNDVPANVYTIFQVLMKYLGTEHFLYCVELSLQTLPSAEPKFPPDLTFLTVVSLSSTVGHLIEKHFSDHVVKPLRSSHYYHKCLEVKKQLLESVESSLDVGLERLIASTTGYIKHIFSSEQKKTDFIPKEDTFEGSYLCTPACSSICNFLDSVLPQFRTFLDGKNQDLVMEELFLRFLRLLADHMGHFTYSCTGAMRMLCDLSEYKRCFRDYKTPVVTQMFDTIFALVDLLVVMPDNIKSVCTSDALVSLERNVLHQFVQLRADYRSARLGKHFS